MAPAAGFVSDMQDALALDMPADYVRDQRRPAVAAAGRAAVAPVAASAVAPGAVAPPPTLPPPPPPTPEDLGEALTGLDEAAGLTEDVDRRPRRGPCRRPHHPRALPAPAGGGRRLLLLQQTEAREQGAVHRDRPAAGLVAGGGGRQPKADLPPPGGAAAASSDQGRPGMTWLASQEAADATSFA